MCFTEEISIFLYLQFHGDSSQNKWALRVKRLKQWISIYRMSTARTS